MALSGAQAQTGRVRKTKAVLWLRLGFACAAAIAVVHPLRAEPTREFQVKAAFLYNFAQFVEWPPDAFASADSPFVIGVLGMDPFGDFLDELVRGEKVNGRPLEVRRYRWVGEVENCHVLFISGSEGRNVDQIAGALRGRSILSVCDWDGLEDHGAVIRFVMEHSRVRLRINLDAARAAGLTISSKLLRSAEAVTQNKQ